MDDYEKVCPRCRTTSYRNPSLKLMVNVCGHALCESCVDLLFLRGSGNCPECKVVLRRNNFRLQLFEDAQIEKELDIRRRILKDFNKREDDFSSLREWNDYLEEVETIIFNLSNDIDVDAMKRKIDLYKKENKEQISRNRAKRSQQEMDLDRMIEEEKYRSEARTEEIKKEEEQEKKLKLINKEALIDELMFSDSDAREILDTHKKTVEQKAPVPQPKKPIPKPKTGAGLRLTSGVVVKKGTSFLPIPKSVEAPLFTYKPQTLYLEGPDVPKERELESRGYLVNVRAADSVECAGGYNARVSCLRALQEAMAGIFFVPSNRKSVAQPMDVT